MPEPFIGEIRMFGGTFAPAGWAFCSGQLMPISENDALFTLIGTTYGGDGQQTFALPDLQGRIPIHQGNSFVIGQKGGTETVTLNTQQLPIHSHAPLSQPQLGGQGPGGGVWAQAQAGQQIYSNNQSPGATMNTTAISAVGGSQPHENMMPFLVVSFIISLFGVFPSQT